MSDVNHPYRDLPGYMYWRDAVRGQEPDSFDPVVAPKFTILRSDPVAAAGSCFAQHIARHLLASGFNFLRTEDSPGDAGPVFSARYGNVYTARQLKQLILRAYGLHRPRDRAWRTKDNRYLDPFRPQMVEGGFATREDVQSAMERHLLAVRQVFEQCKVFIFTLGLTEAWMAEDGTVFPVPPGVVAVEGDSPDYGFHNFKVSEILSDLSEFLDALQLVNPAAKVVLTVSPVPLIATYERRNVYVSNTYSKAALRAAADEIAQQYAHVDYFPSYEIITSPLSQYAYFEDDLRSVKDIGVAHVMRIFSRHFLIEEREVPPAQDLSTVEQIPEGVPHAFASSSDLAALRASMHAMQEVICDEELIVREAEK